MIPDLLPQQAPVRDQQEIVLDLLIQVDVPDCPQLAKYSSTSPTMRRAWFLSLAGLRVSVKNLLARVPAAAAGTRARRGSDGACSRGRGSGSPAHPQRQLQPLLHARSRLLLARVATMAAARTHARSGCDGAC